MSREATRTLTVQIEIMLSRIDNPSGVTGPLFIAKRAPPLSPPLSLITNPPLLHPAFFSLITDCSSAVIGGTMTCNLHAVQIVN